MPQTITATSGEILEVEDVKRYLRIPDNINDEDDEIRGMITSARIEAESISHRTLRPSVTRVEILSSWFRRFYFANPPQHTTPVLTVKYYDSENVQQTVAASNYFVVPAVTTGDEQEGVTYFEFDRNFTLPMLYDRRPDRIEIAYTTGYVTQAAIPEAAKQAVKMLAWVDYYGETDGLKVKRAKQLLSSLGFGFYV